MIKWKKIHKQINKKKVEICTLNGLRMKKGFIKRETDDLRVDLKDRNKVYIAPHRNLND